MNISTGGGSTITLLSRSGAAGLSTLNPGANAGLARAQHRRQRERRVHRRRRDAEPHRRPTDVNVHAQNTTVISTSAEPDGAAVIVNGFGVGRSVAANVAVNTTQAAVRSGATINGARNVSVVADGNQTGLVTAYAGALAVANANSQTLAGALSNNSSVALIDSGASMSISGTLLVTRTTSRRTSSARAATPPPRRVPGAPALATPIALNVATDTATATVAGAVTAAGDVTISADADVHNQAEAIAGAAGADHNTTTANGMVAAEIGFLSNRSNLFFGSAPAPITTTPNIGNFSDQVSGNAAGIGANLGIARSTANLPGARLRRAG